MQSSIPTQHARSTSSNALFLSAALAVCFALTYPGHSYAAADAQAKAVAHKAVKKERVVFQVSDGDPQKWNLALNNIKNVQDALGKDKVDVELVVYGPGIGMLKMESPVGNRVNDTVATGTKIVACETTMHAQKLSKEDMLKSIGYVPGGVIELMKREKEGWAYIRP